MPSSPHDGSPAALVPMIQMLLGTSELEDVRAAAAHGTRMISRYDSLTLYEVQQSGAPEVTLRAGEELGPGARAMEEELCARAGKTGRTVSTLDRFVDAKEAFHADEYVHRHGLCLARPLHAYGDFVGLLVLHYGGRTVLQEQEFDALRRFADSTAVALSNARTREELRSFAYSDPLTGLVNRRGLEREFTRLRDGRLSMLLIDFDGLKAVNDSLGYDKGDALIASVGEKLAASANPNEIVVRLGGDEFVVVMPDATPSLARLRAEELTATLERLELEGDIASLYHGASVGSATADPDEDPWHVLERASAEMRSRKRRRKSDRELTRDPRMPDPDIPLGFRGEG
jgi:diguanylate cyclase (GGDEF)-like protein